MKQVYYNCTLPRFGPTCQYQLYYYDPRGSLPSCLDWSEICDGKIDCADGDFDEKYCWKLEINQCQDNEYRCMNGQCIPQSFYTNEYGNLDCIDGSDINRIY